jgi:iron complex outermembrane receptor protein
MISRALRLLSFAALAAVLYGVPAQAQNSRIRGVVRDANGGALAGATVRATNQATPVSSRATTGGDGSYTISDVAPGTYTVAVSLPGLRTVAQPNILVEAGAEVTLDFVMQAVLLEAVTVTAMLREQELADVPFSIAAPTAQVLRARGAENLEGIAANVAGFSVQNLGPGQSTVAIRGASSGQIARDQPGVKEDVGSYLDDAAISLSLFTPDMDLFDISRVEVLRGPQGTLFGSGSLSGTVRYISNQPELGVSSTFGEVGVNWIDGGAAGNNAKLGFNVPVGDKAAFRIAGFSNALGGWMDALQPNFHVSQNDNGGNRTGLRAAFRIAPNGRFSLTPRLVYQKVKTDGWNRIDAFNILANPYTTTRPAVFLGTRHFTQVEEPFTDEFLLGDVNLGYQFSGVRLTSITSFTNRNILVVRDATALTASITGGNYGVSEPIYTLDAPLSDATKSKVWTQEVRFSGGQERLQWLVGGFYSHNKRHYGQDLDVFGFDGPAAAELGQSPGWTRGQRAPQDHLFWSDLDYSLKQTAVFGEATLGVGERLDLTAGLRYYNFDEKRQQVFDGFFVLEFATGSAPVSQPGSAKANGVAPRFIASYKVSDALTVNAQASQGFRLGGINDPINVPLCTPADLATFSGHNSWTDEKAWNYEVGVKSRVMGGRGAINLSAFYMDIRDLQLTVTAGSCSSRLILNAPKARSQGVEAEVTLNLNEHLDFSVSGSFNDAKLKSTLTDGGGTPLPGIVSGNRLPSVPRSQVAAAATYGWPMGAGSRAFFGVSYQYVGSRFTLIDDLAAGVGTVNLNSFGANTIGGPLTQATFTFNPELPSYGLVNLRGGVTRNTWEVAVFLNNAAAQRAYLALDRERGRRARVGYLTNQPRTVGVSLRFNY